MALVGGSSFGVALKKRPHHPLELIECSWCPEEEEEEEEGGSATVSEQ